jgi:hypothetical protein
MRGRATLSTAPIRPLDYDNHPRAGSHFAQGSGLLVPWVREPASGQRPTASGAGLRWERWEQSPARIPPTDV